MIDLKKIKKIHFTGIKGVGLTALAILAKDMGFQVSGSDIGESFVTAQALKKANIVPQFGFKENRVGGVDLLVYSAGHGGSQNIEVKAAQKEGIPVLSHALALALLARSKKSICIAGVGGKSSTSSMIATVLSQAKTHPSWSIGVGRINPLGLPAKFDQKGKYMVLEADEYFTPLPDTKPKFWYLNPFVAVVTNLEYDHPDVYKDFDHTLKVFLRFIEKVPEDGLVLVCLDNVNITKLVQLAKVPIITYGLTKKADWQIIDLKQSEEKISFNLKYKKKIFKDISISIPGRFNVRNAAATFIVSQFCGLSEAKIKQGLVSFQGTQRRFELIKEINGVKLYDDYAHHPSQIKATLAAAKNWFKDKRIVVVFQPHTYTRTKALMAEFSQAFGDADLIVISDIYASAREKIDNSISAKTLVRKIKVYQPEVVYQSGEKEVSQYLGKICQPGDVIFTMGAGDIVNWHLSIIKSIGK